MDEVDKDKQKQGLALYSVCTCTVLVWIHPADPIVSFQTFEEYRDRDRCRCRRDNLLNCPALDARIFVFSTEYFVEQWYTR